MAGIGNDAERIPVQIEHSTPESDNKWSVQGFSAGKLIEASTSRFSQ